MSQKSNVKEAKSVVTETVPAKPERKALKKPKKADKAPKQAAWQVVGSRLFLMGSKTHVSVAAMNGWLAIESNRLGGDRDNIEFYLQIRSCNNANFSLYRFELTRLLVDMEAKAGILENSAKQPVEFHITDRDPSDEPGFRTVITIIV